MTQSYIPELVLRAASRKLRNMRGFDIDDSAMALDRIEDNTDASYGPGVWVPVYLFLSDSEIQDAGDDTP